MAVMINLCCALMVIWAFADGALGKVPDGSFQLAAPLQKEFWETACIAVKRNFTHRDFTLQWNTSTTSSKSYNQTSVAYYVQLIPTYYQRTDALMLERKVDLSSGKTERWELIDGFSYTMRLVATPNGPKLAKKSVPYCDIDSNFEDPYKVLCDRPNEPVWLLMLSAGIILHAVILVLGALIPVLMKWFQGLKSRWNRNQERVHYE